MHQTLTLLHSERPKLHNPIALRKAKIVCNFGLSECNRVKKRSVFTTKESASDFSYDPVITSWCIWSNCLRDSYNISGVHTVELQWLGHLWNHAIYSRNGSSS